MRPFPMSRTPVDRDSASSKTDRQASHKPRVVEKVAKPSTESARKKA